MRRWTNIVPLLLMVFVTSITAQSLKGNGPLRKFCLIFALPGRRNGPNIPQFESVFTTNLNKVGDSIFGIGTTHNQRMDQTVNCSALLRKEDYTAQCAYRRLYDVKQMFVADLNTLQPSVSNDADKTYMFIVYLASWFFDNVFLSLNCGPVDIKTLKPKAQLKYIAKWSNHLSNRSKFCPWVKPLSKSNAIKLRQETQTICTRRFTEPICELESIFDFVDSMEALCNLKQTSSAWADHESQYYRDATNLYFYSMRVITPDDYVKLYHNDTTQPEVQKAIGRLFTKFYEDFIKKNLTLVKNLLQVLPRSRYLPCDFTATFPAFKWLVCTCGRSFTELRAFVKTYETITPGAKKVKHILANANEIIEYIKNLKVKQIEEIAMQQFVDLSVASTTIKNNIQDRFQELATYFSNVANFEKSKIIADVEYLESNILANKKIYEEKQRVVESKIKSLILSVGFAGAADLIEATSKFVALCAKAASPIAAITDDSGSDRMDALTEIAEAAEMIADAVSYGINIRALGRKSIELQKKLSENDKVLLTIKAIMDTVKVNVDSENVTFDRYLNTFLNMYSDYTPAVDRDDMMGMQVLWEAFIDDICNSLGGVKGAVANSIVGIGDTKGKCAETRIAAAQLAAALMQIYDEQFELVESMAQVVLQITRMQAAKVIGSGPRAENPHSLNEDSIKTLMAVSTVSYIIVQTVNVYSVCDCYEFEFGKMPSTCKGIATDLDALVSLSKPLFKFQKRVPFQIPTKNPTGNKNDLSWIDIGRLYKGETVPFRIPDFNTLKAYGGLPESMNTYNFYLLSLEFYLPVVSQQSNTIMCGPVNSHKARTKQDKVKLTVTPTNRYNTLVFGVTNYVIYPSRYLHYEYVEGSNQQCATSYKYPYIKCGANNRTSLTTKDICLTVTGANKDPKTCFPSLYSLFNLRLEGYENENLDPPGSNFSLPVYISYKSRNSAGLSTRKRRQNYERSTFSKRENACCVGNQYYDRTNQCKACPTGMKSFIDNLYCGEVVKLNLAHNISGWTYADASASCTSSGTEIAGSTVFNEAKTTLSQKGCICGWVDSTTVDSLTPRSQCDDTGPCSTSKAIGVYCKTKYTP